MTLELLDAVVVFDNNIGSLDVTVPFRLWNGTVRRGSVSCHEIWPRGSAACACWYNLYDVVSKVELDIVRCPVPYFSPPFPGVTRPTVIFGADGR